MDLMTMYDITYALAAQGGREELLFGNCSKAAREAFSRSLTGEAFPELWFEIPLAGDPWMDFHALTSYEDVAGKTFTFAGHGGVYADALAWFSGQAPGKVRQLALSYNTSTGDAEQPAVQLLVNGPDPAVPCQFLEAVGFSDAKDAYRSFTERMAVGWYACYVGMFPKRLKAGGPSWVRVECIVGDDLQRAYADDTSVLRGHLADVGMKRIDGLIDGVQELARSPFPLELQFNVGLNGAALPTLSASVRFQPGDWTDGARRDAIGNLASWMQSHGLADGRCGLLAQTAFATRAQRDGKSATITCFPAFVKLRYREGLTPDAKSYLLARVQ